VFCMGLTLYTMLVQRHPFARPTPAGTIQAIRNGEAPDPRTLRPDLPQEIVTILGRALARDRNRRYRSAAEMGAALRAALVGMAPRMNAAGVADFMAALFGRAAEQPRSGEAVTAIHRYPSPPEQPAVVVPVDPEAGRDTRPDAELARTMAVQTLTPRLGRMITAGGRAIAITLTATVAVTLALLALAPPDDVTTTIVIGRGMAAPIVITPLAPPPRPAETAPVQAQGSVRDAKASPARPLVKRRFATAHWSVARAAARRTTAVLPRPIPRGRSPR
jgi:hypothetical protein